MLAPKLPEDRKDVAVIPKSLTVVASEDAANKVLFVSRPLQDISEIADLARTSFSLESFVEEQWRLDRGAVEFELAALRKKFERFGDSPKYLVKLAELAHLTEQFELESEALNRAAELENSSYYLTRLGDALLGAGEVEGAASKFVEAGEKGGIGSLLRLAALNIKKGDLSASELLVKRAVELDEFDFAARLFEGALHLVHGRFEHAIRCMRIALQERPNSSVAHCNVAIAHLGVGQPRKALRQLKRAAALDPLNANAVSLLADVAFSLQSVEDSIASLRYFVSFEQRSPEIWSRLARAAFVLGRPNEALAALKYEAGLHDTAGVWNNMGVAYGAAGQKARAISCFAHAMKVGEDRKDKAYLLAAKNYARWMAGNEQFEELNAFVIRTLAADDEGLAFRDTQLADLVILHVYSSLKLSRVSEAESLALAYLEHEGISDALSVWLVSAIAGIRSLSDEEVFTDALFEMYLSKAEKVKSYDNTTAERFFNNIAVAFAEEGRIREAESVLAKIPNSIHASAYPTATFGLIQLKKGNLDRAAALYEEAVSLAPAREDKNRIRQKYNLELGRFWMHSNERRAKRFLEKARKEASGEPLLVKKASELLKVFPKS